MPPGTGRSDVYFGSRSRCDAQVSPVLPSPPPRPACVVLRKGAQRGPETKRSRPGLISHFRRTKTELFTQVWLEYTVLECEVKTRHFENGFRCYLETFLTESIFPYFQTCFIYSLSPLFSPRHGIHTTIVHQESAAELVAFSWGRGGGWQICVKSVNLSSRLMQLQVQLAYHAEWNGWRLIHRARFTREGTAMGVESGGNKGTLPQTCESRGRLPFNFGINLGCFALYPYCLCGREMC